MALKARIIHPDTYISTVVTVPKEDEERARRSITTYLDTRKDITGPYTLHDVWEEGEPQTVTAYVVAYHRHTDDGDGSLRGFVTYWSLDSAKDYHSDCVDDCLNYGHSATVRIVAVLIHENLPMDIDDYVNDYFDTEDLHRLAPALVETKINHS